MYGLIAMHSIYLASDARNMAHDINTLVFGGLVELEKFAVANSETLEQIRASNRIRCGAQQFRGGVDKQMCWIGEE